MKSQNVADYPEASLAKFADEVFTPLKNGQCVTSMFVAGGGKRTLLKRLFSHKIILKNIFNSSYEKTLFVQIDPDEVLDLSAEAYLQLILDKLVVTMMEKKIATVSPESVHNSLILIKNNLENLIASGWHIVFILNDFEFTMSLPSSIYLNLEAIMAVDKSKITYLFLLTVNIFEEKTLKNLHNLKYAISRNVEYYPLRDSTEKDRLIDCICSEMGIEVNKSVKELLGRYCGGHPQLLKYAVSNLKETGFNNSNDINKLYIHFSNIYQLKVICADIFDHFSDKEKEVIMSIVTTGMAPTTLQKETEYLSRLGLIRTNDNGKYQFFGTLFEEFIKNKLPKNKLTYDINNKKMFYGSKSCEDKFTYQEFKLLAYFITHENDLVSRDQVAEAIWGKLYLEKYSDWSIDKTISVMRKKLDAIGFGSEYLTTLKKRGFVFTNP